jgi:hypothetical protein
MDMKVKQAQHQMDLQKLAAGAAGGRAGPQPLHAKPGRAGEAGGHEAGRQGDGRAQQ